MTAEQRVELLKRVSKDPNKKLSFSECDEIAKDLNLSLEQVAYVCMHFFVSCLLNIGMHNETCKINLCTVLC